MHCTRERNACEKDNINPSILDCVADQKVHTKQHCDTLCVKSIYLLLNSENMGFTQSVFYPWPNCVISSRCDDYLILLFFRAYETLSHTQKYIARLLVPLASL